MRVLYLCFVLLVQLASSSTLEAQHHFEKFEFNQNEIVLKIDPRIELYNVMGILLGNPRITPNNLAYKREVIDYFSKHKKHHALEMLLETIKRDWGH